MALIPSPSQQHKTRAWSWPLHGAEMPIKNNRVHYGRVGFFQMRLARMLHCLCHIVGDIIIINFLQAHIRRTYAAAAGVMLWSLRFPPPSTRPTSGRRIRICPNSDTIKWYIVIQRMHQDRDGAAPLSHHTMMDSASENPPAIHIDLDLKHRLHHADIHFMGWCCTRGALAAALSPLLLSDAV